MKQYTGFILFVFYLILGVVLLPKSMATWDEPENYFVGRVYLNVFRFATTDYFANPDHLPIAQPLPFRTETHWERYPPFAITLASLSSFIFAETAKLVPVIYAHHLVVVFFAALAVVGTYSLARFVTGSLIIGLVSSVVLFFWPVFLGHAFVNIKDIPFTALFVWGIYTGVRAMGHKRAIDWVLFGAVVGLGLATKVTMVFVICIVVIWSLIVHKNQRLTHMKWIVMASAVALGVCLFIWPWFMLDVVGNLYKIATYIQEVGRGLPVLFFGTRYQAGINVPFWYAPVMVAIQMPIVYLAGLMLGIGWFIKQKTKKGYFLLICIWILVVFARYINPNVIIYNGSRHVMEVLPALSIVAGCGLMVGYQFLRVRFSRVIALGGLILVLFLALAPSVRLYPYSHVYFNPLVGGVRAGASQFEFDYWGFSVGELVSRANTIDPDGSIYVEWIGVPGEFFPGNTMKFVKQGSQPADYVIIPHSLNYFEGAIAYWKKHGRLVDTIKRDGAVIGYLFSTHK